MKSVHAQICAVALGLLVLAAAAWRESGLSDDLGRLRTELEALRRATSSATAGLANRGDVSTSGDASFAPFDYRPNVPAGGQSGSGIGPAQSLEARVGELEATVNAQADLIEELLASLSGVEVTQRKANAPGWSPLQATGAPDSTSGDQRTAWAPATQDGGMEWLQVDFPRSVEPVAIVVHENCGPGAIIRLTALDDSGRETSIWQGVSPSSGAISATRFPISRSVVTQRIKIYLDTAKVEGWNEIDAVQIIGKDGSLQWAVGATASSSYGAR
jgi:HAMP domain-containing protein